MQRVLMLLLALGFAGCFSPTQPVCSFACADSDPKCPTNYTCQADGYCHLNGSPANMSCGYSDASVPNDMAVPLPVDMTSSD